jgi:hypothetical protein
MNTILDRALLSAIPCVPLVLITLVGDYANDTKEKANCMWASIQLICNPGFFYVPINMPLGERVAGMPASWLLEYIRESIKLTCHHCNHICSFEQHMLIHGEDVDLWCCITCKSINNRIR